MELQRRGVAQVEGDQRVRVAADAGRTVGMQAGHPPAVRESLSLNLYQPDALFRDPELDDVSGHTLIAAELATRYGITDEGGRTPPSHRQMLGAPREPSPVIIR